VVRLQKKILAMGLPALAIFNNKGNPQVVTLQRPLFPPGSKPGYVNSGSSKHEAEDGEIKPDLKSTLIAITTAIRTAFTLIGFVCQIIRTRELC
jgi:hypothetical protein